MKNLDITLPLRKYKNSISKFTFSELATFKVQGWFYIMILWLNCFLFPTMYHQRTWIKSKSKVNLKWRARFPVCDLLMLRCWKPALGSPGEHENTGLGLKARLPAWGWVLRAYTSIRLLGGAVLCASTFRMIVLGQASKETVTHACMIKVQETENIHSRNPDCHS